jgi:predicted butyrate kinase (DUF1464 family)
MPRVLGIDPGTLSFDLCGLADGEVFFEASLPSVEVAARPELLLERLSQALPLDLVAGPSGYGLPLVPIAAVGERELRLVCLAEAGSGAGTLGLRRLLRLLRESGLPVVLTPGVHHLPSVPLRRKLNRVDLGTADKVCCAALGIEDQAERLGIPRRETAFVLVELGGAFTAVLSVAQGRIVSGQGGSSGPLGYLAAGAMDAELAVLLRDVGKALVFSGGAAYVAGDPALEPEALARSQDAAACLAREALVESVFKTVAGELAIVPQAREVLLSGRLSRIPGFREPLAQALAGLAPVRDLAAGATKHAARGAALVADGLLGGRHRELVDALGLREARGTVLDHVYLKGADAVRRWAESGS